MPVEQVLAVLATAPERIATATEGLSPERLRSAPTPGEWSAVEVLAHFRACADVWGHAIETILAEEHPTIRALDPRSWVERTDYRELAFAPSLRAFAEQRARLLALLEPLPPEGWARAATVTGAGSPLVRTVFDYARRLAIHERPHIKQLARIAAQVRGS